MQCRNNILTVQGGSGTEVTLTTLLTDLFPFYQLHSITSWLLALQVISLLVQLSHITLTPSTKPTQFNTFQWLIQGGVGLVFTGRFISQHQSKLGKQGILLILGCLQMVRICASGLIALQYSWPIPATPTLYALHMFSLIDLRKWTDRSLTFSRPAQVYPQQDLLDLNDTVIKMTPVQEPSFLYQSYTNRSFYYHNIEPQPSAPPKPLPPKRTASASAPAFDAIADQNQSQSDRVGRWVKFALIELVLYSLLPTPQMIVIVMAQLALYFLLKFSSYTP